MSSSNLLYLRHEEINKNKWDECVTGATNSLIYAHSFYLDALSPQWNALVSEAYDWVLPITAKRKFAIRYLCQPNFTQQLGVFYKPDVEIPWREIIECLQNKFSFWEINWNYGTAINFLPGTISRQTATNFILDLSQHYQEIAAHYHNDLQKNLKRSKRFSLNYVKSQVFEKAVDLYFEYYHKRLQHVKLPHYNAFKMACKYAFKNNMAICREVIDENNHTLAIAILLYDRKRLYNIMNTTTNEGKKAGANHFLIDSIIQEFSESKTLLDFEGSDLPGVKSFYENFGAVDQPYYLLKYNHLPFPLRLLKK